METIEDIKRLVILSNTHPYPFPFSRFVDCCRVDVLMEKQQQVNDNFSF